MPAAPSKRKFAKLKRRKRVSAESDEETSGASLPEYDIWNIFIKDSSNAPVDLIYLTSKGPFVATGNLNENDDLGASRVILHPIQEYSLDYPAHAPANVWVRNSRCWFKIRSAHAAYSEMWAKMQVRTALIGFAIDHMLSNDDAGANTFEGVLQQIAASLNLSAGHVFDQICEHVDFLFFQIQQQNIKSIVDSEFLEILNQLSSQPTDRLKNQLRSKILGSSKAPAETQSTNLPVDVRGDCFGSVSSQASQNNSCSGFPILFSDPNEQRTTESPHKRIAIKIKRPRPAEKFRLDLDDVVLASSSTTSDANAYDAATIKPIVTNDARPKARPVKTVVSSISEVICPSFVKIPTVASFLELKSYICPKCSATIIKENHMLPADFLNDLLKHFKRHSESFSLKNSSNSKATIFPIDRNCIIRKHSPIEWPILHNIPKAPCSSLLTCHPIEKESIEKTSIFIEDSSFNYESLSSAVSISDSEYLGLTGATALELAFDSDE